MKKAALFIGLVMCFNVWSYDYDLPSEASACSLSIKIELDSLRNEDQRGKASVLVRLVNKDGNPLSGYTIGLSSNAGTFICEQDSTNQGADTDDGRGCFMTKDDGIARIRLIGVPLNTAVRLKATCDCGDYQVSVGGNLTVSQKGKKRP